METTEGLNVADSQQAEKEECTAREKTKNPAEAGFKIGRRERIRTSDPLVPNQLRYQAALLADVLLFELLIQFIIKSWCEGGDSNPHILRTLTPEASASTNSATFAYHRYCKSIVTTEAHSRCFQLYVNRKVRATP